MNSRTRASVSFDLKKSVCNVVEVDEHSKGRYLGLTCWRGWHDDISNS